MGQDQDPKDTEGHRHEQRPVVQDDDDTTGHRHEQRPVVQDDDSDVEGHKHDPRA